MEDYSKRRDHILALARNVFKKFVDACGGNEYEMAEILYSRYTVEDFAYHDDMITHKVFMYFNDVVVPHKIEVYKGGGELIKALKSIRVSEDEFKRNLWLHDLSKFSADEAFGYAMHDFKNFRLATQDGFEAAWHHHKMHNPHHPEHWLNPNKSGQLEIRPMPMIYIVEMVADWIGAGRTYGSSLKEWLSGNLHKFVLHQETSSILQMILDDLGYNTAFNKLDTIKYGTNLQIVTEF